MSVLLVAKKLEAIRPGGQHWFVRPSFHHVKMGELEKWMVLKERLKSGWFPDEAIGCVFLI